MNSLLAGYKSRVKRHGVLRGTVEFADPRRLAPSRRQKEALTTVARRIRIRGTLDMVQILRREGEGELALAMLDGVLSRFPYRSQVLIERAVVRQQLGHGGAIEDLVAACAGDLRNVSFGDIAAIGISRLEARDLVELKAAVLARRAEGEDPDNSVAVAVRVIELAESFARGGSLRFDDDHVPVPQPVLALLADWSRRDLRWEDLYRVSAEIDRLESAGETFNFARVRVAEALRVKGDLSRSVEVIAPVVARSGREDARRLVAQSETDLRLLRNGWPAPRVVPRAESADGRMAYLLHNSLPYTSGGYSTRTHGLLASMARRGWHVDGITRPRYPLDRPEGEGVARSELESGSVVDGVHYSRILERSTDPTLDGRVEFFGAEVARRASFERWGVIHAASNHFVGLAAVEAAARSGLPSVYEVRGLWEITRMSREPGYGETERFALAARLEADACRHADYAFAITEGLRSLMIERGAPADRIALLPNGVDINRFTPGEPNEVLRDKLGLRGKTVIGYVGSVVDYEGLELLVEAVARLVRDGQSVALLIVGDGAASESVNAQIAESGIRDHVVMPGRVPHAEAESYYSLIDIAPFPRLPLPVTELVSPLKPFEAMAMAKPVVVSSVAALTEIVTDGVNGRVFTKGSVEDLAETLASLIENERDRAHLGAAGREWVAANRSWDALSARIVDVYEKLGVPFPVARD